MLEAIVGAPASLATGASWWWWGNSGGESTEAAQAASDQTPVPTDRAVRSDPESDPEIEVIVNRGWVPLTALKVSDM